MGRPSRTPSGSRAKNYSKGPCVTLLESFPTPLPLYEKRQSLGGSGLENDCRNRPREGPENLAPIETLAMGFLATPKARSARSLASASTPAVSTSHQHTIGMQLRQLREFLERRR